MDGRGDDVARTLRGALDDPLAEVGLGHVDATLLEVVVEVDLLGRHRLRLHGSTDPPSRRELGDQLRGVHPGRRVVHLHAEAPKRHLGPRHVDPEVPHAGAANGRAAILEHRDPGRADGFVARVVEAGRHDAQRAAQLDVLQRRLDAVAQWRQGIAGVPVAGELVGGRHGSPSATRSAT